MKATFAGKRREHLSGGFDGGRARMGSPSGIEGYGWDAAREKRRSQENGSRSCELHEMIESL